MMWDLSGSAASGQGSPPYNAQPRSRAFSPSPAYPHAPRGHSTGPPPVPFMPIGAPGSGTQPYGGQIPCEFRPLPTVAPPRHEHFIYSKCTGRKKALCIGINYRGQPNQLYGCINDARNVQAFLMRHGYRAGDIEVLTDDSSDTRRLPTRNNIIDAMHRLVRDAHPHDSLFFHYSGHGAQVKDKNGDEIDGYDEVIFPLDHKAYGYISDDLMHTIMVKSLPAGCRLTALFDSCHSGSVLDLPYLYHTDGRVKGSQVTAKWVEYKSTPADVISWSGCKDSQTSADTFEKGVATGAMSYAFMTSLSQTPNQSYQELLRSIRVILKKRYSQKPQLSSSHRIDTNLRFII
ncbi:caspase domain-containing protein [Trametes punicea]|nr:caspase domain-containing protein [Trametes punicea]